MGRPDDAVEFATRELEVAQRLTDRVVTAVDEPVLAAVLLGKSAQAQERGIDFTVDPDSRVSDLGYRAVSRGDHGGQSGRQRDGCRG